MDAYDFVTPLLRLGIVAIAIALIIGGACGYGCKAGCFPKVRVEWSQGIGGRRG